MKRLKKPLVLAALLLAACLCIFGLQRALGALQHAAYPQKYAQPVRQYAAAYGVDPCLVWAIVRTESGFDPNADSAAGARGLMQITDETFAWIKLKIAPAEEVSFADLYDPETNIRFGTYLLSVCMQRYGGDVSTAAAAYHSGIGKVDALLADPAYSSDGKTLKAFPYAQMNNYVRKVNRNYGMYTQLYGASAQSASASGA